MRNTENMDREELISSMPDSIRYGVIHLHTWNSLRDSAMSEKRAIETAKALDAPAVTLTDHGTMTGYLDFIKEAKEAGVKPVIGVEAYMEEQSEGRRHLLLLAKDYEGFRALIKAVTESNRRITKLGTNQYPRMNEKILLDNFGEGAPGHGHVIATSACIAGVLGAILLANKGIDAKVKKFRKKQESYTAPDDESLRNNVAELERLLKEQISLREQMAALKKASSRSLTTLVKKAAKGTEEDKIALEKAEQERKSAAEAIPDVKKKQDETADAIKTIRPIVTHEKAEAEKWLAIQHQIDSIMANQTQESEIGDALEAEALRYQRIFGADDFYIELQNHGMREEKKVYQTLSDLSDKLHIPAVITNDCHIATNSPEDIEAREVIRATMFDTWEDATAADGELYIKTDRQLVEMVSRIIPAAKVREGYENIGKIIAECNLEIPKGKYYPAFKTPDGSDVKEYLEKRVWAGAEKRYPGKLLTPELKKRIAYELSVITSMGYADYHCIVQDFLRYARAVGKLDLSDPEEKALALTFDTEKIEKKVAGRAGEYIGPGRGSAAGSVVCYCLGITNIDPIRFGLLFERFLNPERVSMPDIDSDIETGIRPYVIEYVKHKYGEQSVSGILTMGTLAGKAAVQTSARVLGTRKKNDTTAYLALSDQINRKALELTDDELHLSIKKLKPQLDEIFKDNETALQVIRWAALIEGTPVQLGMHAAGIIITDGHPVSDIVPLAYNTNKGIMMTQCDMIQAEENGLLKMDFLGLNNLTVISETLKDIQSETGKCIEMYNIGYDDKEVYKKIFDNGMTNSVFQFESDGMKKMLKEFKPENIFDLTLLVAMFRPGPLQFLPDVIAVKNGRKKLEFLIPELEPILKNTYGSITYQEQVQEIFRQLAGYSFGQADIVRRAMSKKKEKVIQAEREAFIYGDTARGIKGCKANGIDPEKANILFDQMTDFAKYAFNKSHAACYAVVAYQTAWLKLHYPKEYIKSVLNHADFEKVPGLIRDAKAMGIPISAPDANRSELAFSVKDGKIVFGLGSIKGLGASAEPVIAERKAGGAYQSVNDFVLRTLAGKTVLEGMVQAGAFDTFNKNRKALMGLIPDYLKLIKKLKDYQKKLAAAADSKRRSQYQEKLDAAKAELMSETPDQDIMENHVEELTRERELIGAYASGHPMDYYPAPASFGGVTISAVQEMNAHSSISTAGIVEHLRLTKRKSDGAEMAFFTLSDSMGDIEVCCFTRAYSEYGDKLKEGEVLKVYGQVMDDDKNPGRKKLSMYSTEPLRQKKKTIILHAHDIADWHFRMERLVKPYVTPDGNPTIVVDLMMNEVRRTDFLLNPSILRDREIDPKAVMQ